MKGKKNDKVYKFLVRISIIEKKNVKIDYQK